MLEAALEAVEHAAPLAQRGTVVGVRGLAVRVADLAVPVGAEVRFGEEGGIRGEVVGVEQGGVTVVPLGPTAGIRRGDRVVCVSHVQSVRVGRRMLGRVIDALGEPVDGGGPIRGGGFRLLNPPPLPPLGRPPIDSPLATGVRAIDALLPLGRGQRVGVFAGPGVGKSTLLGQMAKRTAADVTVVALIGERGREVNDFITRTLGPEGLARSVVVAATGDDPAPMRVRAALVAATVAEAFREEGKDVLLLMDSVTRFCQAGRQIGLAAGEPPTTRGYPPSVFASLPVLMERAGRNQRGSITGLYAILVEGDELSDPIADAARGILDGHLRLSPTLAQRGHYPAIDPLTSISRVADDVTDPQHIAARRDVLRVLADHAKVEDLANIGAYASGSNLDFDVALAVKPAIDKLLIQSGSAGPAEPSASDPTDPEHAELFDRTRRQLLALQGHLVDVRAQLSRASSGGAGGGGGEAGSDQRQSAHVP